MEKDMRLSDIIEVKGEVEVQLEETKTWNILRINVNGACRFMFKTRAPINVTSVENLSTD